MKKLLSVLLALAVAFAIPVGPGLYVADAATDGTAISTEADLKAMENNPSGSYYLANDIELSGSELLLFKNKNKPFTGTLDGNGHKINGYKYTASRWTEDVALFVNANGATFKNLTMSNVDIQMTAGGTAAGLAAKTTNCKFENIKTTGNIKIKNRNVEDEDGCNAYGMVHYESGAGTFKNCTNGINIEITHYGQFAPEAVGIVGVVSGKGSITNCTNNGDIKIVHTHDADWGSSECVAVGIVNIYSGTKTISGCKNTGNLSITGNKTTGRAYGFAPIVTGIARMTQSSIASCKNTGKLSITNNTINNSGSTVVGIADEINGNGHKISKCSNSGAISYTGKDAGGGYDEINAAGIISSVAKIEQSYNKGKISVNSNVTAYVGGLAGYCADMRNCYNTGAVTHKGKGYAGGLAGEANVLGGYIKSNYSTGKVTGTSKKLFKGQLIGYYGGGYDVMKRNIYDNYYKTSGKAYGGANFTWKPWLAKATKVSAITAKSCPKLSSKYWTYSSKYKRMILKNNKEK